MINEALDKYAFLDGRDKSMFVKIIHGSLEYRIRIDHIIDKYSSVNVERMKPLIRNVLRMSVYQILYLDKIPDSAVCDEAVKLVKRSALKNLSGFVNGVLRTIARDKDAIEIDDIPTDLSVRGWMYDILVESIGKEETEEFLKYVLAEHGVSVRSVGTDEVYILDDAASLTASEAWNSGRIIAQDYSSSLPVIIAGVKKGDTVLDVCAAPGGKSIQAAEKVGEEGHVIACDLTEYKIDKIKENIKRLRITNIETRVRDALIRDDMLVETADVVIADCPCSGIGTISKKPEIKNRLSKKDCLQLAEIQRKILDNVCDYVKKGGKLLYSTCTLDHFENEDNIKAFLERHKDFRLAEEKIMIPSLHEDKPYDGFYIALMIKND